VTKNLQAGLNSLSVTKRKVIMRDIDIENMHLKRRLKQVKATVYRPQDRVRPANLMKQFKIDTYRNEHHHGYNVP
jgi:hypothetical protein